MALGKPLECFESQSSHLENVGVKGCERLPFMRLLLEAGRGGCVGISESTHAKGPVVIISGEGGLCSTSPSPFPLHPVHRAEGIR